MIIKQYVKSLGQTRGVQMTNKKGSFSCYVDMYDEKVYLDTELIDLSETLVDRFFALWPAI